MRLLEWPNQIPDIIEMLWNMAQLKQFYEEECPEIPLELHASLIRVCLRLLLFNVCVQYRPEIIY